MRVSEIFTSIQGEGLLAGTPSVFIRTSGCNLRCTWCDTPYTSWHPEGREMDPDAIMAAIEPGRVRHAVVTGGEPMISPQVVRLTERLKAAGMHITVETAGSVYAPVVCDLMSISPKLANSTPHERERGRWAAQHDRLRYQPGVLKRLMSDCEYQLKFVVMAPEDMPEILAIIDQTGANRERVCLMPEGTDPKALYERGRWLWDLCIQEGFHYTPRLHVELFGNRRGI